MQLNPVYLYPNRISAYTSSSWTTERFRQVYTRNIKIYRSTDNQLEFQVKNGDQKASNIIGTTIVFNLFNHETQSLLLTRDCQTLSNISGNVRVVLTEKDLLDLEPGLYSYSIIQEMREVDVDDSYTVISKKPLYIDEQFGAVSTLEIVGDVQGGLRPTTVVKEFSYTNPATVGESKELYFISSMIDARPKVTDPQSLHTFQFYFNDFDGAVTIQGSLSDSGDPMDWVDVPDSAISPGTNNFTPVSGTSISYKNVVGKYNWFRIKQTGHQGRLASFTISADPLTPSQYDVTIQNRGSGYQPGDVLIIEGKRLGGDTPDHNLSITVETITGAGLIGTISYTGTPKPSPNFRTYVLEPITNVNGRLDKILYR